MCVTYFEIGRMIGKLLCRKKNDNIVELTLPENSNIYAHEYSLYLPDKDMLQQKLSKWMQEFREAKEALRNGNERKDGEA